MNCEHGTNDHPCQCEASDCCGERTPEPSFTSARLNAWWLDRHARPTA